MTALHAVSNHVRSHSDADTFTVRRYAQFAEYVPRDCQRILDVGCGTGLGGTELKRLLPEIEITGLDCDEGCIAALPEDYDHAVFGRATAIPATDGTYCAVIAGELIDQVGPADAIATLEEMYRVLRHGGVALLTTPHPDHLTLRRSEPDPEEGRLSLYRPRELGALLRDAGFSSVKFLGSGRVSGVLGARFPVMSVYGSYLAIAEK
jgi:SAM-dependent methyltransferase